MEEDSIILPANLIPTRAANAFKPRERVCAECYYGVKERGDLVCRRNPPQVTMLQTPTMVPTPQGPRQGFEIKSFACYPPVQADGWCGEFRDRSAHS